MRRSLLAIAFATLSAGNLTAQDYPTRPLSMVVPFAAGGSFDVLGRVMAPRMGELLGQQVVIENPTGAAGILGTLRVKNAEPDGYTFLLGSIGTHAYNPSIYKNLRYDPVKDFAPVGLFADQPMVLVARKNFPANNLQEFIAYVRANAAKIQYGSAGVGSTTHLSCSLLTAAIGVEVTHIPYRGGGPAAQDLLGGQIDYLCLNIGGGAPLIMNESVKGIATLSRERASILPNLPTAHEQGLKDFDVSTWNAFFLPPRTPEAIVKKLNEVTSATIDTPAMRQRLEEIGVTPVAPERRSPEYLAKFIPEEIARWAGPIKAAGIQVD